MGIILEKEAEEFLEKNGFDIVKGKFIKNKEEIIKLKTRLIFPWAVKVYSKKIVHKTKAGGVILNITSVEQAEQAFNKISKLPGFEGAMIQEMMMHRGQLIILGLKNTPEFGLTIMVGAGGGQVEELKDISFRICPIKKQDAKQMLSELKIKIKSNQAKNKIINNLLKLSKLAERFPNIQELDINPIVVNEKEAIVVDARIVK